MVIDGMDCEYMPTPTINKLWEEYNEQKEIDLK
jgi:hypothetical protein